MSEMKWDLSVLVESTDPERVREKLAAMIADHVKFAETYRGKVGGLDAEDLAGMLRAKDDLFLRYEGAMTYCSLIFTADQSDPVANSLNHASSRAATEADQVTAFLSVELGHLLASRPDLVEHPTLRDHRHYLERYLRVAPHLLSEPEEKVISAKDQTGVSAWSRLQSKWLSTRQFRLFVGGEEKVLSMGEIIPFIYDQDRATRRAAYTAMGTTLGADRLLWAEALSAIWNDHLQMCKLRSYPSPLTSSLIANDVDERTITTLMEVVKKNAPLCHQYLALKAGMLGLERLGNWDLRAPLPGTVDRERSWDAARDLLVSLYGDFDPEFGEWVRDMFDRRHLDGEVRKGKRTGAFCDTWVGGRSAFILSSYNGQVNDVYTLAHELGHAVHAYLYTRDQNPSNCAVSLCVAECGSMFGELLLTERLLAEAPSDSEKRSVLVRVMNSFVQTVYQEGFRYFFEMDVARAIEEGRFLDSDAIADMWMAAQRSLYGDIDYLPEMRWDWARFPHHYFSDIRFYEYPYVFAQLFVFALFRLYREQGAEFVPRLKALLSAGSSRSPLQLAAELGFDIGQQDFWQKGIDQAKEYLAELERLR
jgi:oligoendopeptidase F